jgi:hypothetical protein
MMSACQSRIASLEISRRIGQKPAIARALHEIGKVLAGQTKLDLALKQLQEALTIRKEIGDKQGVGDTLISDDDCSALSNK